MSPTIVEPAIEKISPAQETTNQLRAAYNSATEDDRKKVLLLVKRAVGSKNASDVVTFTPGMAAILFFDHNKQNRTWDYATSREYARQAAAGLWQFTNQGIGFLASGALCDGQHRLAGFVLAGLTVEIQVTFGMDPRAIDILDTGKRRTAADILDIQGVEDAARKVAVLTGAYTYLAKRGDKAKKLIANAEKRDAVKEQEKVLEQAIDIGAASVKRSVSPALTVREAQVVVFLMLISGWSAPSITEKLSELQGGENKQGDSAPFFVTAKILTRDAAKGERISQTARCAAVVKAFQLEEHGSKAINPKLIRDAMKPKNFPDPGFQLSLIAAEQDNAA